MIAVRIRTSFTLLAVLFVINCCFKEVATVDLVIAAEFLRCGDRVFSSAQEGPSTLIKFVAS